jgi:hypothetical protein
VAQGVHSALSPCGIDQQSKHVCCGQINEVTRLLLYGCTIVCCMSVLLMNQQNTLETLVSRCYMVHWTLSHLGNSCHTLWADNCQASMTLLPEPQEEPTKASLHMCTSACLPVGCWMWAGYQSGQVPSYLRPHQCFRRCIQGKQRTQPCSRPGLVFKHQPCKALWCVDEVLWTGTTNVECNAQLDPDSSACIIIIIIMAQVTPVQAELLSCSSAPRAALLGPRHPQMPPLEWPPSPIAIWPAALRHGMN